MKKKICGKETSEVKLKLNSSLYGNDRSITFPVLQDNSLVQSINKQGMHVPIDEHSHFSALRSTNVRQMFKCALSPSYRLEQSPMDNPGSHTALPDNSRSLPTLFPPRNQHVPPPPPACQEEFPKAQISLLLISVQTDSVENHRPSGYLISEWSSFQISEKKEKNPLLTASPCWKSGLGTKVVLLAGRTCTDSMAQIHWCCRQDGSSSSA